MMTNFADIFDGKPTGTLSFIVRRVSDGAIVERFEEKNLIVDLSKQVHAKLLGGAVTNQSIAQIGFGTNGTAPVVGNTSLTGAYTKAIDGVSYPATNQVQFNFSLASTENNGMAIMEFGLLTAGGTLYARKVRSAALNKDTDVSITGSWIISF
jgi:hypothetical protein